MPSNHHSYCIPGETNKQDRGSPRRTSSSSGGGEASLEKGVRRAEGLAVSSQNHCQNHQEIMRTGLSAGQVSCFQREKKDEILELYTNWLMVKPQKNYGKDYKEGFVSTWKIKR